MHLGEVSRGQKTPPKGCIALRVIPGMKINAGIFFFFSVLYGGEKQSCPFGYKSKCIITIAVIHIF